MLQFNIIIEISCKDDSIWSIGCQETPAEWLLKPKNLSSGCGLPIFVEGVPRIITSMWGLFWQYLFIDSVTGEHWINSDISSVQINSLVLLSQPNKTFGLGKAFHELGWHSQNELDNWKPELGLSIKPEVLFFFPLHLSISIHWVISRIVPSFEMFKAIPTSGWS